LWLAYVDPSLDLITVMHQRQCQDGVVTTVNVNVRYMYNLQTFMTSVLSIEQYIKGVTSIMSHVVEKERPGHWLGLVLCVPFSALTPMVG